VGPIEEFIRALEGDGWTVWRLSNEQPYMLEIKRGDESRRIRVYIWNVTLGGPPDVRAAEERRIQKTIQGPLTIDESATTLLLGWHAETGTFVSWNPRAHQHAGWSASIHVPLHRLEEAEEDGLAVHPRDNPAEVVVIFAPEAVSQVLAGLQTVAPLRTQDAAQAELVAGASAEDGPSIDELAGTAEERRQAAGTVRRWSRDARFRPRVLRAYQHRCAFCGLGLGLVQAAHIVPVSVEDSTDETANGIALCPTCHAAFDANLVTLLPDYSVAVNEQKVQALTSSGSAAGLDEWLAQIGPTAAVPDEVELRPRPEYVQRRLESLPGAWRAVGG
jgi:putative restriction endonuclease